MLSKHSLWVPTTARDSYVRSSMWSTLDRHDYCDARL